MKKQKFQITPTRIKTTLLAIVIAIVLSAFVIYLIQTIHPRPEYEDYCGKARPVLLEKNQEITKEMCEANGGVWENSYCDYYSKCNGEYENARDRYRLMVFIVAVIAGLTAVSVGILLELPVFLQD